MHIRATLSSFLSLSLSRSGTDSDGFNQISKPRKLGDRIDPPVPVCPLIRLIEGFTDAGCWKWARSRKRIVVGSLWRRDTICRMFNAQWTGEKCSVSIDRSRETSNAKCEPGFTPPLFNFSFHHFHVPSIFFFFLFFLFSWILLYSTFTYSLEIIWFNRNV